jgi:hypothetical protein
MASLETYDQDSFLYLKAEALCAELLSNGLSFNKVVYQPLGAFKKSYRPDIDIAPESQLENESVGIVVNRDGLYDKLPEGLFHQTRGSGRTAGISEMVGEFRRFREEEKNARKFFQPLEQEFFRYGSFVEQQERNLLLGMLGGKLNTTLQEFWGLESGLPAAAASVLVRILPWAARIKGDLELTARALGLMLGMQVQPAERFVINQQGSGIAPMLGDTELGVSMVTGPGFSERSVVWEFTIQDIPPAELSAFLPKNEYGKFLSKFTELLIPVEIDEVFIYELDTKENESWEPVLGYSMVL